MFVRRSHLTSWYEKPPTYLNVLFIKYFNRSTSVNVLKLVQYNNPSSSTSMINNKAMLALSPLPEFLLHQFIPTPPFPLTTIHRMFQTTRPVHVLGYQHTLFQLYIFDSKEIRTILFWLCEFPQKDTFWGRGLLW